MRSPPRNGALVPLAAAGLALGVAALYLRLRVLDAATETIAAATGDLIALFYPLMRYGFSELAAGRLPLWNPYQSCGEPLLANPSIGFFYPLYLPFLWLDTARAIDLDVVIHLALSAVGTALLCRHLRMGWAAALLAGLVYAFHGSMLIKIPYPGFLAAVAWIPLIFLLVDRVCAHPTRRAAAGLGTVLGISLLGGNLQFTYFTAWALVPWLAARTWTLWRRGWPHVARAWGYLALAGALAIGLALVRLLPGAELMQLSWRAPGSLDLQHTAIMAIPPRLFAAGLVTPPAAVAANLIAAHFYADSYAGVLPLCLAIAGLVLWRQRAVAIALAAAGAAAALYAFGTAGPLFGWVFALPGGSLFRAPDRALIVFGFAVAVLSGAGLEALARGQDPALAPPARSSPRQPCLLHDKDGPVKWPHRSAVHSPRRSRSPPARSGTLSGSRLSDCLGHVPTSVMWLTIGMKLLEVRIMSILQAQIHSFSASARIRRSALLCTLILLLPVAAMQLAGADQAKFDSDIKTVNAATADSNDLPSPDEFIKSNRDRNSSACPVLFTPTL